MHKTLLLLTTCFVVILATGCSDDDNPDPTPSASDAVRIQRVVDFRNQGDASDLIVIFQLPDPGAIDELRMIIGPITQFSALQNDNAQVQALAADRYKVIPILGEQYEVTPGADLLDITGAPIVNGTSYRLGFITVKDGIATLDKNNINFEMKNQHYLTGRYIGTWDDNIYTAFGVSADIRLIGGKMSGAFYYTSNFVACCGGDDDGTISFTLDDTAILDFQYDQNLITFMNGCPGFYTGDGQVKDFSILEIDFEGDDCEGPHTGGRIRFEKL